MKVPRFIIVWYLAGILCLMPMHEHFSATLVCQTIPLLNFRLPGCQWILNTGPHSAYFWPLWYSDFHQNKTQSPP